MTCVSTLKEQRAACLSGRAVDGKHSSSNTLLHCVGWREDISPHAQDAPAEEPAVKVDAEKGGEEGEEKEAGEAEDAEEAEEDEEPKFEVVVATAPHDPRFPSTNQARHCYTRYNEFYRCGSRRLCGG